MIKGKNLRVGFRKPEAPKPNKKVEKTAKKKPAKGKTSCQNGNDVEPKTRSDRYGRGIVIDGVYYPNGKKSQISPENPSAGTSSSDQNGQPRMPDEPRPSHQNGEPDLTENRSSGGPSTDQNGQSRTPAESSESHQNVDSDDPMPPASPPRSSQIQIDQNGQSGDARYLINQAKSSRSNPDQNGQQIDARQKIQSRSKKSSGPSDKSKKSTAVPTNPFPHEDFRLRHPGYNVQTRISMGDR